MDKTPRCAGEDGHSRIGDGQCLCRRRQDLVLADLLSHSNTDLLIEKRAASDVQRDVGRYPLPILAVQHEVEGSNEPDAGQPAAGLELDLV